MDDPEGSKSARGAICAVGCDEQTTAALAASLRGIGLSFVALPAVDLLNNGLLNRVRLLLAGSPEQAAELSRIPALRPLIILPAPADSSEMEQLRARLERLFAEPAAGKPDHRPQASADNRLQEHRDLQAILESTLAGYWVWNVTENRCYLSPRSRQIFGYEEEGPAPSPAQWIRRLGREDRERLMEAIRLHFDSRGETPLYAEVRFPRQDGATAWVACWGKAVEWTAGGRPSRVVGCHVDLTVGKQTEERLRGSELLYRTLFDSADDAILLQQPDGRFAAANRAALERLGYGQQELLNLTARDVVAPESRRPYEAMMQRLSSDGRAAAEMRYLAKDGRRIPMEVTAAAFTLSEQNLALTIARDVTERERAQVALHQSEEKFHRVFADAPMLMSITTVEDGRYLDVNRKWEQITGWSRDEAIGRSAVQLGLMPAGERDWLIATLREAGQVSSREVVLTARGGSQVMCSYTSQIAVIGGVERVITISRDTTYRKLYEEERELMLEILKLANSPTDTRELIRGVTAFLQQWSGCEAVGIRLRDGDDFPYYETVGFSKEFVLAESSLCVGPAQTEGGVVWACVCGAVLSGAVSSLHSSLSAGGSFWTNCLSDLLASVKPAHLPGPLRGRCMREGYESVALAPLTFAGRPIGMIQFNDRRKGRFTAEMISLFERAAASVATALEQRRMQAALKASEEKYRLISENTADAIWLWDMRTGRLAYVSPSLERLTGYTAEEVLGMGARRLLEDGLFARMAAELPERVAAVENGCGARVWTTHAEHRRKDGAAVPVEVVTTLLTDEHNRVNQVLGVSRDVTERQRVEEERAQLEQQLIQAQRLESVGRLAGGVAHDFNNLLTVINGYSDIAIRQMPEGEPLKRHLTEIRRAGERAASLTSQLLAFSRRQAAEPQVVNLNELILEARNMAQHILGEAVELRLRLSPLAGRVLADPGQLHQVLMNLVVNARDAIAGPGAVMIETGEVEANHARAAAEGLAPGLYATFTITDSGCGMDSEILRRAFEPFFTTKAPGKGTGLGLSMVYGIVRQWRGWVEASSEPGLGATFRICLPQAADLPMTVPSPAGEFSRAATGETVLVVEDQQEVRDLVVTVLRSYGYRTLEAADGVEAMELAAAHTGAIHLVITDIVMPRMTGRELAEKIRVARDNVKILFMSGHAGDGYPGELKNGQGELMRKPFTPGDIVRRVRAMLEPHPYGAA